MPDGTAPIFARSLDELIATERTPAELERQYGAALARDGTCRACSFRRASAKLCDAYEKPCEPTSEACSLWDWDQEPRGAALREEIGEGDVGAAGMEGEAP